MIHPDPLSITPLAPGPFQARMTVPGSKSGTNRALLLAALSEGTSVVTGALRSDDCDRLVVALQTLGVRCVELEHGWEVHGAGGRFPRGGTVDLGDGGTPARFMLAAATLCDEPVTIDGSARLRERPMGDGIRILESLGARFECLGEAGHLPVRCIRGITGGEVEVGEVASSQFLSAALLVAPWTTHGVTLRCTEAPTSAPYLRMTMRALAEVGAEVHEDGDSFSVKPNTPSVPDQVVPPDASTAAYWWLVGALVPGSRVTVPSFAHSMDQPDATLLSVFEAMGAEVARSEVDITLTGGSLAGIEVNCEDFPDGAVALGAACALAETPSRLTGLHTLRVKECDRVHALATEIERFGGQVVEHSDALDITPAPRSGPDLEVAAWNDHRMAMAFGALGLVRSGVSVCDPGCVGKSHPGFWNDVEVLRAQA
ncbi:MAG: 3-phosphoshikimate 1-carboxyvinyltransferase [Planctomycetota bacterium]